MGYAHLPFFELYTCVLTIEWKEKGLSHWSRKVTQLIGVSLSEPQTSLTALVEVVCMFAAIYRKF